MNKLLWKYVAVLAMFPYGVLAQTAAPAQTPLTWEQVRQRFEQSNPTLRAGQIGIDESKAQEITAYLRPNPSFNVTVDGTQIVPYNGVHRPLAGTYETPGISYLHERRRKRELRLESAQKATGVAVSGQADLERTLLFTLRMDFGQTLQEKAILHLAKENFSYFQGCFERNHESFLTAA